jgi:hypothetical protein
MTIPMTMLMQTITLMIDVAERGLNWLKDAARRDPPLMYTR